MQSSNRKAKGSYDVGDRIYCLYATDIINDISVLAVARKLCPEEHACSAIEQLSTALSAHNTI
nr:DUF1822 family protein [Nostoc sp. MG11]